jgi:predicted transcriptional regulator
MDSLNRCEIIKPLLKKAGQTQKRIAEFLDVSPQCVNQVVLGQRNTEYIRDAIAFACRVKKNVIWPN